MKKTVIIEIDDAMVKALYAVDGVRGRYIAGCDTLQGTELKDADIISFIKQIKAKYSIQSGSTEVIAVMPRNLASFRYYRFPSHNYEEIKKMVDLQMMQFAPYADNDMVVNSVILKKEGGGYAHVLAVIVPKNAVERMANILYASGLPQGVITLSSWGILNWARYQGLLPAKETGAAAVITLEEESSEICICSGGELHFSRELRDGYRHWKKDAGYKEYLRQIKLTIDAYHREKFSQPLIRIAIVSVVEDPQLLRDTLQKQYDVPVDVCDPLSKVLGKKELEWPQPVVQDQTILVSAAGLLLVKERKAINLVSQDFNTRQRQHLARKSIIRIALWAICVLVMTAFVLRMRVHHKRVEMAMLNDQLETSRIKVKSIQKKKDRVTVMKSWLSNRVYVVELVDELNRQMPENMELKSLVLQGRRLVIQGSAPVASEVNTLQQRMVESAVFAGVSLDYVNRRKIGDKEEVFFKITTNVQGGS